MILVVHRKSKDMAFVQNKGHSAIVSKLFYIDISLILNAPLLCFLSKMIIIAERLIAFHFLSLLNFIQVEEVLLREWRISDRETLAENANSFNIWLNLRDYFPHPYTLIDADKFIKMVHNLGSPTTELAIEVEGKAVGGIGIMIKPDVERVCAELGYWLGERYWGRGIMTRAVKEMVNYSFANFPIRKLSSPVFEYNVASRRVLEKVGFELEGIARQAAIKNGKIVDMYYYGKVKD